MKSTAIVSSLLLGLSLTACLDSAEDANVATSNTDKVAMNALPPGSLTFAVPSTQLTTTSAATQLSTANGRSTFSYIAGCALGTFQTFTSGSYSYTGSMGLATAWMTRALTASEANAVSSCLIGRLNRDGVSVSISLRGANAGFATSGTETTTYNLDEGAFMGNIFPNLGAIDKSTCMGADKAATPNLGDLANRHCTEAAVWPATTNACGLTYIGTCASACTMANGYYTCTAGSTTYDDAATTFISSHSGGH